MKQINIKEEQPKEWVDALLKNAIQARASDVHLEPERDSVVVRFRIDGILYSVETLQKQIQEEIISRIKVLSSMDITEHRFPQDGHIEFPYREKIYNIRVSTFPTIYGEVAVLRILNREDILIRLENLGLEWEQGDIVNKLITQPFGMILITGPSGSGKTVFLYSTLYALNQPNNNIITFEDPIEFQMDGVRQIQINESLGLSFSRAMHGALRQDPDIIMVGEIRDADTAQMATQAALTGKLLFSTFHTLDVPGVLLRFIEMGVPRSVVAHAISGVVSSRLVRRVCLSCKEPYRPNAEELRILGVSEKTALSNFQKGRGCATCRNSGYLGRTGIFEIVYFDEDIKVYILEGAPIASLKELFRGKKIKTLRDSAVEKVIRGITTVEEMNRAIGTIS